MRTGVSPKRIATRNFCCLYLAQSKLLFANASHFAHGPCPLIQSFVRPKRQACFPFRPLSILCARTLTTKQQSNPYFFFLRKEVIQPHLPIRLPCYDFTPVIRPAFGGSFLTVRSPTSGISDSHGVTGGVYKTRERIQRSVLICVY